MVQSNVITITVEPSSLVANITTPVLIQPGSCSSSSGQLCSGGSVTIRVDIQGDLSTVYNVELQWISENGFVTGTLKETTVTDGTGAGILLFDGITLSASCFLGSCLGGCTETFTAFMHNSAGNLIATSNEVVVYVDCACTC